MDGLLIALAFSLSHSDPLYPQALLSFLAPDVRAQFILFTDHDSF